MMAQKLRRIIGDNLPNDFGKKNLESDMGGMGSGRQWHWYSKSTTGQYLQLDIRRWARDGYLEPGRSFNWQWTVDGESIGNIGITIEAHGARFNYRAKNGDDEWEPMEYLVRFLSQPCHFGGTRKWFACPARGCGRRVAILYGDKIFACRHCHQLAYPSQREEVFQRATRRADNLREKLGWERGHSWGAKPKGMHASTFLRLTEELDYWDSVWNSAFVERYAGLLNHKS